MCVGGWGSGGGFEARTRRKRNTQKISLSLSRSRARSFSRARSLFLALSFARSLVCALSVLRALFLCVCLFAYKAHIQSKGTLFVFGCGTCLFVCLPPPFTPLGGAPSCFCGRCAYCKKSNPSRRPKPSHLRDSKHRDVR